LGEAESNQCSIARKAEQSTTALTVVCVAGEIKRLVVVVDVAVAVVLRSVKIRAVARACNVPPTILCGGARASDMRRFNERGRRRWQACLCPKGMLANVWCARPCICARTVSVTVVAVDGRESSDRTVNLQFAVKVAAVC